MTRPHLRLVSSIEPHNEVRFDTITFARSSLGLSIFHNGKVVSLANGLVIVAHLANELVAAVCRSRGVPVPESIQNGICAETDGDCA